MEVHTLNERILNGIGRLVQKNQLKEACQKKRKENTKHDVQNAKGEENDEPVQLITFEEYSKRATKLMGRHHHFEGTNEEFNDLYRKEIRKLTHERDLMLASLYKQDRCKIVNFEELERLDRREDRKAEQKMKEKMERDKLTSLRDGVDLAYIPEYTRKLQDGLMRRMFDLRRQTHHNKWHDLFQKRKDYQGTDAQFRKDHTKELELLDSMAKDIMIGYSRLPASSSHNKITKVSNGMEEAMPDPGEIKRQLAKFPDFVPFNVSFQQKMEKLTDIQQKEYGNDKRQFLLDYQDELKQLEYERELVSTRTGLKVNQEMFEKKWDELFQKMDQFNGTMNELEKRYEHDLREQSSLGTTILRLYGAVGKQEKQLQHIVASHSSRKRRSPNYITRSPLPNIKEEDLKSDDRSLEQEIDKEIMTFPKERSQKVIKPTDIPGEGRTNASKSNDDIEISGIHIDKQDVEEKFMKERNIEENSEEHVETNKRDYVNGEPKIAYLMILESLGTTEPSQTSESLEILGPTNTIITDSKIPSEEISYCI